MTLGEMPLSKNTGDEEIQLFTDGDAGEAGPDNNSKSEDSNKEVMVSASAGASSTISPGERDQHNSSTAMIVLRKSSDNILYEK